MTQTATLEDRLPWGTTSEGEFTRPGTLLAFVMGAFAVFITFPLGILGIVLSCMGLDRIQRREASARTFVMWSWICFAPGAVIGAVLSVLGIVSLLTWLVTSLAD
jgi:hypothetical protein